MTQGQHTPLKPDTITFGLKGTPDIIKIEKGTFYWKGKPVEDEHEVYERFNEWLHNIKHETQTIRT